MVQYAIYNGEAYPKLKGKRGKVKKYHPKYEGERTDMWLFNDGNEWFYCSDVYLIFDEKNP